MSSFLFCGFMRYPCFHISASLKLSDPCIQAGVTASCHCLTGNLVVAAHAATSVEVSVRRPRNLILQTKTLWRVKGDTRRDAMTNVGLSHADAGRGPPQPCTHLVGTTYIGSKCHSKCLQGEDTVMTLRVTLSCPQKAQKRQWDMNWILIKQNSFLEQCPQLHIFIQSKN